jgi:hypothetical protein
MINSETQPQNEANTLATVAGLYPLAFAMVAASNSRAGLALRRFEIAGSNASRNCVDQPINSSLQSSAPGLPSGPSNQLV